MADASDPFAPEAFQKPPREVTRFFNEKKLEPSWHWQDVWGEEHAHAFTVAKTAGYDVLGDIRDAVKKALDERQDFEQFRAGLEPILKSKGWWGKASAVDPLTGKSQEVQLGSARRLKTIYWANIETAYAAGDWERSWRTRKALPYLEYLISTAAHKRLEHLAQVGTVEPVESPYWDSWYPPSAWGCQCRVRQISQMEAETRPRFGQTPEDLGSREFVNKRTGEVQRVPNGIDPGWHTNPGKTRMKAAADLIGGRLDAMPEDIRRIAATDLADGHMFRLIASGGFPFDPASLDPEMINRGQIALPFASLPKKIASELGSTARTLRLSAKDAASIDAVPEDYALVQTILDHGKVASEGTVEAEIDGEVRRLKLRVEAGGAAVYLEGMEGASGE